MTSFSRLGQASPPKANTRTLESLHRICEDITPSPSMYANEGVICEYGNNTDNCSIELMCYYIISWSLYTKLRIYIKDLLVTWTIKPVQIVTFRMAIAVGPCYSITVYYSTTNQSISLYRNYITKWKYSSHVVAYLQHRSTVE